jgi:hypothetical protein
LAIGRIIDLTVNGDVRSLLGHDTPPYEIDMIANHYSFPSYTYVTDSESHITVGVATSGNMPSAAAPSNSQQSASRSMGSSPATAPAPGGNPAARQETVDEMRRRHVEGFAEIRRKNSINMQIALEQCFSVAGLTTQNGNVTWAPTGLDPSKQYSNRSPSASSTTAGMRNAFDQTGSYVPRSGTGMPPSIAKDIEHLVKQKSKMRRYAKITYALTSAIILASLGVSGYSTYLALHNP